MLHAGRVEEDPAESGNSPRGPRCLPAPIGRVPPPAARGLGRDPPTGGSFLAEPQSINAEQTLDGAVHAWGPFSDFRRRGGEVPAVRSRDQRPRSGPPPRALHQTTGATSRTAPPGQSERIPGGSTWRMSLISPDETCRSRTLKTAQAMLSGWIAASPRKAAAMCCRNCSCDAPAPAWSSGPTLRNTARGAGAGAGRPYRPPRRPSGGRAERAGRPAGRDRRGSRSSHPSSWASSIPASRRWARRSGASTLGLRNARTISWVCGTEGDRR